MKIYHYVEEIQSQVKKKYNLRESRLSKEIFTI